MKNNPKDHLQAVNAALAEELAQKKPSEAVLLACAMFKARCEKNAHDYQNFRDMVERVDNDK